MNPSHFPPFPDGQRVRGTDANQLLAFARSQAAVAGAGLVRNGRTLTALPPAKDNNWRRNLASAVATIFQLTGTIEAGPVAKISITRGMVGNACPTIEVTTGVFVSLAALTPPKITVTGAAGLLWLECSLNAVNVLTACVVRTGTSIPADSLTPGSSGTIYRSLGDFTSGGGVFTSVNSHRISNQEFFICGGIATWSE